MAPSATPWPARSGSEFWDPQYCFLFSSSDSPGRHLFVTANSLIIVDDVDEALQQHPPETHGTGRALEFGLTRSDYPKELCSSWRLPMVSFERRALESSASIQVRGDAQQAAAFWDAWMSQAPKHDPGTKVQIFGAFVRTRPGVPKWFEICSGSVRSVHVTDGNWIDVFIDRDLAAAPASEPFSEPRDLKLSLVMVAALGVWLMKLAEFSWGHSSGAAQPSVFFNLLHDVVPADIVGHIFLAGLVVVHHTRMAFGVEFAGRDTSFFRAKLHASETDRQQRMWGESLCLALIVSLSVFLTYVVGFQSYAATASLLFIQGLILLFYDWMFWDALLNYDDDRSANRYAVRGDFIFLLASGLMVWPLVRASIWGGPATHGQMLQTLLLVACILYVGYFVFETGKVYWSSLRGAFVEFREAVKQTSLLIRSSLRKRREKWFGRRSEPSVKPSALGG